MNLFINMYKYSLHLINKYKKFLFYIFINVIIFYFVTLISGMTYCEIILLIKFDY